MLPSNHLAILSHLQRIIFMSTTQTGQTEYVLACNKSQQTDIVQMNNKKQDKEPSEEVSVSQKNHSGRET